MKTVNLILDAAGRTRTMSGGFVFIMQSLSAGENVDVTFLDEGGLERGTVNDVATGLKFKPGFFFGGFQLAGGTAGAVIQVLIGDNPNADADLLDAVTIENPALDPVPVTFPGGTINLTATEVGLTSDGVDVGAASPLPVTQALATTITSSAAVAVTAALTDVLAAGTRRGVRLFNQGAAAVAIGGAGLTWANRAVVLEVGDSHEELVAPGAAIKAICAATLTATLGVQVLS